MWKTCLISCFICISCAFVLYVMRRLAAVRIVPASALSGICCCNAAANASVTQTNCPAMSLLHVLSWRNPYRLL